MDGSKSRTDTLDYVSNSVGRRSAWVEASAQAGVNRAESKILLVVAAKRGQNPLRLKDKVFTTTFIGRELVSPNPTPNGSWGRKIC